MCLQFKIDRYFIVTTLAQVIECDQDSDQRWYVSKEDYYWVCLT